VQHLLGYSAASCRCPISKGTRLHGNDRVTYGADRSTGWFLKGAAMLQTYKEKKGKTDGAEESFAGGEMDGGEY
jgi:hypothetical protein